MFFESLDSLDKNIMDRNNYHISLTLDIDDEILNHPEVIERINSYENVSIEWGMSKSKVDAINRSMPDYDFDVIICWSNDMFMVTYGADDIMRASMYELINAHGDELLFHFPEPDTKEFLNVLYVATRKFYERFNYIYHPSYLSLWCDNETLLVSKLLNKYHFIGTPGLYEHRNPAYSQYGIPRDALFDEQQGYWGVDERNFHERQRRNFDLFLPMTPPTENY